MINSKLDSFGKTEGAPEFQKQLDETKEALFIEKQRLRQKNVPKEENNSYEMQTFDSNQDYVVHDLENQKDFTNNSGTSLSFTKVHKTKEMITGAIKLINSNLYIYLITVSTSLSFLKKYYLTCNRCFITQTGRRKCPRRSNSRA